MRAMRRAALLLLASSACGGAGAPTSTPAPPAPRAAPSVAAAPLTCAAADVRELLARHARAYGDPSVVAQALPVVVPGTATVEGKGGPMEIVLDRAAFRSTAQVAGLFAGGGMTPEGSWVLGGASGLVERLRPGVESRAVAIDPLLWRREYVARLGAGEHRVACTDEGGAPRLAVTLDDDDLGRPVFTFDRASAALLSVTHAQADGQPITTSFRAWGPPDANGVRWPRELVETPAVGSAVTMILDAPISGLSCRRLEPRAAAARAEGAACLAPPPPSVELVWPASRVVRVPMKYLGGELLLRVRAGARETWAFLDSGAGITAVDATTPAGESFVATAELAGAGATQKIRLGVGELAEIGVGELIARHVPAASVPIPALEAFGDKRPEIILGYTFLAGAAVRVDFRRSEIAFAHEAARVVGAGARAVPMRVLGGKLAADARLEGEEAVFELDTGNASAFSLLESWADAHGLPGARPTAVMRGLYGAGT